MLNNKRPNQEPCGTGLIICRTKMNVEFLFTLYFLLFKKLKTKQKPSFLKPLANNFATIKS